MDTYILAIESSCDETSVSIIKNGSIEISNIEKKNNCTITNIMNNECNQIINNEQIEGVYLQIKAMILAKKFIKNNTIIKTENTRFQVTNIENQESNNTLSVVDLGECQERIKKKYNISKHESLIILKADIKSDDFTSTYVQYEIYHPYKLNKIELDICEDVNISLSVPVNLDDETISLYESLNEYGYNFFDSKDKFYNDICSKYTTKSGTDIILSDRQQLLKNQNNVFLCQDDCTFLYYNSKTKHSYCSCSPQKNDIKLEIEYLFSHKGEMIKSFYTTLSNSNFKVMKPAGR